MSGKLRCKCDGEAWINRWRLEDMGRPRAGMQFMGMGVGAEEERSAREGGKGLGALSNPS